MRVLITVTGAWGTGSFQVAQGVADALIESGHQVKLFFPDGGLAAANAKLYYENKDLYEIWRFPIQYEGIVLQNFPLMLPDPNPRNPSGITLKMLTQAERAAYFQGLAVRLQQVIRRFNPDVIECQHVWAMDHVVDQLGLPFIAVAHNSDQIAFAYDPGMQAITRQSAAHAKYLFAVSESVKHKVIELYRVGADKVIVLPCGYEQQIFYPQHLDRRKVLAEFELAIPENAKIVSSAGKLSKTKGADILLKASSFLSKEQDVHFIIMGSGNVDDLVSEEEKQFIDWGRFHFVGHRSLHEVARVNNISDLAVIPSRSEGFCIAGLEAIACGVPLIMTEGAHAASYAVAAVVPDESPELLANAINDFFRLSEAERELLQKEALNSAQHYTWKKIAQKRLLYYQKALIEKDFQNAL